MMEWLSRWIPTIGIRRCGRDFGFTSRSYWVLFVPLTSGVLLETYGWKESWRSQNEEGDYLDRHVPMMFPGFVRAGVAARVSEFRTFASDREVACLVVFGPDGRRGRAIWRWFRKPSSADGGSRWIRELISSKCGVPDEEKPKSLVDMDSSPFLMARARMSGLS